jgi:hypothetical protein
LKLEVLVPILVAWVEKPLDAPGLVVDAGEIRSLEGIAEGAKTRRTKLTPIDPRLIVR